MKEFRVDLHLHTCLSPCGSLEMSPRRIVETALERKLDAIAITDHNSTMQCSEVQLLGEQSGLLVFAGVEVTTREEAHCVVLFANEQSRAAFQEYLDEHLPVVPNDPERFGYQVWVNAQDEIVGEAPCLLISALDQSVGQIAAVCRQLDGLFIAAHVERPSFSLISQLGFINPSLPLDAIEFNDIVRYEKLLVDQAYLKQYTVYCASDAHYPEQIGTKYSLLRADTLDFQHLKMAFRQMDGHTITAYE